MINEGCWYGSLQNKKKLVKFVVYRLVALQGWLDAPVKVKLGVDVKFTSIDARILVQVHPQYTNFDSFSNTVALLVFNYYYFYGRCGWFSWC